jgi:isopenicillin N synthase-like dioxygenase
MSVCDWLVKICNKWGFVLIEDAGLKSTSKSKIMKNVKKFVRLKILKETKKCLNQ